MLELEDNVGVVSAGNGLVAEDPTGGPLVVPGCAHELVAVEHEQRIANG
jgi:hypothetical protein